MEMSVLQEIGLNKSEAKIYLALLEIGPSTTGPIMNKARISSSKIYGILNRLIEKGLVSFVIKAKTKYFQAASPETLLDYLDEKEEKLKHQHEEIKKILPLLQLKQKFIQDKQEAQVYLGWKGIMNAYTFILDRLNEGDDYAAFAQTRKEEGKKEVKLFFTQFQKKRERKKVIVKLIADISQKKIFDSPPYTKFKNFHVKFVKNCPPGIIIGKEHIFISAFEESPVGVIIASKEIARYYKKYFYSMWEAQK